MAQFGQKPFDMTSHDPQAATLDMRDLPPRGRSHWEWIGRWAAGLLIGAWCLCVLVWIGLYGVLLPRVGAWKPEIESQASRLLGVTVRIGEIEVPSSGWVPALHLSEVVLMDAQGRVALRLPRVSAALSPRSLLSLQPRFEQLLIEGAALEVRRDTQGRLRVAGLVLEDQASASPEEGFDATDWLLAQGEFAIRGAQLRWVDERRAAPPLELQDVNFVLRNTLRRHEMRLDATPPPGFGGRWTVQGRFRHSLFAGRSDWREWSGELYASLPETDVAAWRVHVDLPPELLQGRGAARVWIDVDKGRIRGATADVALGQVALRWPGVRQPMEFRTLQGRMLARQDRDSVTLGLQGLGFTTGQGLVWPASDMKLVLRHEAIDPKKPAGPTASAEAAASAAAARAASAAGANTAAAAASAVNPDGEELWAEAPTGLPLFELLHERQIVGGEFTAARLDLALMASIASRAPLGAAMHEWLVAVAPQGRIEDMSATWEGPVDQPRRYRVGGRLSELRLEPGVAPPSPPGSTRPRLGRPGVGGANVVLEATEAGGRAELDVNEGSLSIPGFFEESRVPLQALRAKLAWRWREGSELEVTLSQASVRNEDLSGEVQATWRANWAPDARGAGHLDLRATIARARAEALVRYLPVAGTTDTRSYLRKAIRGGELRDLSLRIDGDLDAFPFATPGAKGQFRVTAQVREGILQYLPAEEGYPAWPELSRLDAKVKFDGQRLEFSEARGRIFGTELSRGSGRLDLMQASVPLTLDFQARGPAPDFLRFVKATPIDRWLGGSLSAATSSGTAGLALKLDLPLYGNEGARVRGTVQLAGNDLHLTPGLPSLHNVRGRIDFSERGFAVVGGTAQLLGGEVSLDGGIIGNSGLRLNLQGMATAAALREAPELAWLRPVSGVLHGQTAYRAVVTGGERGLSWGLTSTLEGLGVNLPAPLGKAPSVSWAAAPLKLQVSPVGTDAAPVERIELGADSVLQSVFMREGREGGRLLQAAVGVGVAEPPTLPPQGLELTVVQDRLDGDAWRQRLAELVGPSSGAAAGGSGSGLGAGTGAAPPASAGMDFSPRRIRLQVRELTVLGRHLDDVRATFVPLPAGWRADLTSTQMAGRIDWLPAVPGGSRQAASSQDRVVGRLTRLSIPATAGEGGDGAAAAGAADEGGAQQWPALDVVAEDFELRGRRLGRLEIEADVRDAGRHWQLRRLSLQNPDAALSASGSWAAPGDAARRGQPRITTMDVKLDLRNAGELLRHMGYTDALKGGKGPVQGQLSWRGSPLAPDIRSMQGQLRMDLQDGQFLKADPGAARLLGVLSLQSLPRRLVLDFRDVFQEGFPFDVLDGDVQIRNGVARTGNLRMRGLQAAVLMDGSADILSETQDLRVLVVPEINAGTASLAYATINPALGLGTFLAQLFLRRPLMAANTREFQVSGSWTDPKVERVQRKVPLSPEEAERAAAAMSAPPQGASSPPASPPASPSASPAPAPSPSTKPPSRP